MLIKDFKSVNKMLNDISGKNHPGDIYVDNLHSPYIRFEETFVIPASSITHPEFSSVKDFVSILSKYLPEAIEGTCLLPEPRPKRETGKLFFVRPIVFSNKQFLYVFATDMQYLGGASGEEIKKPGAQNLTPSIITDRIYFQVKIFPIESLKEDGDHIIDFKSQRFQGGVFRVESDRTHDHPIRRFSEIFDEIDFSDIELKIREELGINSEVWQLGRVYSPIGIDYLALSLRFLTPSLPKIIKEFRNFYSVLDPGENGVQDGERTAYHFYLKQFAAERAQSRSGNMLWKINFTEKDHTPQ
ncbi:LIC_10030 family protein [Leptospira ilyithenensis]|uniref:Uncharacterized protein n=1 Tax=Leptospira ilyithenensis TaxID=2484901 RepID=A0A4R9LS57_9LEPT|nr:hypothetical protein [Leptospira ilyithenensis]TGN10998.1 hypothetical protein EHS11_07445 [Leptospira ilyithenensis]